MLKVLSVLLFLASVSLIIAYGKFNNEFIRITLLMMCLACTFYANVHWLLRICCVIAHVFVIIILEMPFLRELIMQLACFEIGQCLGGSSFNQLEILNKLKITNGSILVDGHIEYKWQVILFWRTMFALTCHYLCILATLSLSMKLGVVTNQIVETTIEEIPNRPTEDSATMFSFVKQQFFHKSLAYAKHEKGKGRKIRNKFFC